MIGLVIDNIDTNTFLFTFSAYQEKERVLANHLWNFKGFPTGLSTLASKSIHELALNYPIFWVQIHGLPLEMLSKHNSKNIGLVLGNLIEIFPFSELHLDVF